MNILNNSQLVVNMIDADNAAKYILNFDDEMNVVDTATAATTALKAYSVAIANLYAKWLDIDVKVMS
jgi:hypothetical protein